MVKHVDIWVERVQAEHRVSARALGLGCVKSSKLWSEWLFFLIFINLAVPSRN